jgi:ribulose-phosphate 3-epimerase
MIEEPAKYAPMFVDAGADRISFHPEVVTDVAGTIGHIKSLGAGAGIAVHPDVSLDVARDHLEDLDVLLMMTVRPGFGGQAYIDAVTPKIAEATKMVQEAGLPVDIEVDGGVNLTTVDDAVGAGGEIIVAGSAVYDGIDAPAAAKRMREKLDRLAGEIA